MHLCYRMVLELSEWSRNTRIRSRWCNISFANENCYFALSLASSDASISISHFACVRDQVLLVLRIKCIHDAVSALVLHLVASYYLLRHTLHLYLIHVAIMFCGLVLYMCTVGLLFIFHEIIFHMLAYTHVYVNFKGHSLEKIHVWYMYRFTVTV